MDNPKNSQKNQEIQELKQKYLHLKKLYCKISAALKHKEEELKTAHKELSFEVNEKNLGPEELIIALKKQNEQLRKLNATKDKFISIIAHDLKSPFHSIIGFSRLLHQKIHSRQFDNAEKISEIILLSANNAMDLLKDLLEWALVQTGNAEFKKERFKFLEIINQIESLFADVARQKGVVIQKKVPQSTVLYADQEMISVVLRNLISNAIKFTNKGGRITVSAEESSGEVIISVADTGIGIPNNKLNKLFKIDEDYKRSGTGKEGGTGLGLVLCKEFVEKHGGKIWFKSKEGEGSTFYFTLPCDVESLH